MPIAEITARPRLPILGKIRLGVRQEGGAYPKDVHYFVLRDAPGVAEVYGEDPSEIDAIFPSDDEHEVLPTWYKMYGTGKKDANGKVIAGKLLCKGDGPRTDIIDGETVESPGTAEYFMKRDPETREVPKRPCLGKNCPDYISDQCSQSMKVIVILPKVSLYGGYVIDTTSWYSIRSFHDQIALVKSLNGGSFKFIPFKIVREETATPYWDKKTKSEKVGMHHIMYLRPNEKFFELHGAQVREKIAHFKNANFALTGVTQAVDHDSMEDHWPVLPAGASDEPVIDVAQKRPKAEDLLNDPDVLDAFARLETATGKQFNQKARLQGILQKQGEDDLKQAVLDGINRKIAETAEKKPPAKAPTPVQKPVAGEIL